MAELGPGDLRLMQGLAQQVTARQPALLNGDATIGELAWVWGSRFYDFHPYWRHRLWFVDDELTGWGWVCLPHRILRGDGTFREAEEASLTWQVHPDRSELLAEILDWFDEVAGGADRWMIVQSADEPSQAIVTEHGYVFDEDDEDWIRFNARDLVDLPAPVLADGFRFVTADDVSVAAAAGAHRAAWHPSPFTDAALARVARTWPYRPDLHLLVEAPDNTLVATAIVWFDELTRTAEFEPVGTHVDFRRRGLGRALQLHGMHRARAAGAELMLVACLGGPSHPAAQAMYDDVGFEQITRDLPHIKTSR